jgi:hypothetical protein
LPDRFKGRNLRTAVVFALPRMNHSTGRRTLKWMLIAGCLAAATIAYWSVQPDRLAGYKAQLTAAGEELSLSKLSPGYSLEAANFQRQLNDLAARLVASPIPPADISLMAKTSGGIASVAWNQPTPAHPKYGTWDDFAVQMDQSEPPFMEIRRLLAAPPQGTSYDHANSFNTRPAFDFISRRKIAQALAGAVVNDLHQRRLEAALTNLNALIALARLDDDGGVLIDRMLQVAIAGLAASATWEALQNPSWTETQLTSLQSSWQSLDQARGFARTIETERAFGVTCYEMYRTNATQRRQMFGLSGSRKGQPIKETLYESIYLPVWASTWAKGDELRFLEIMQPLIEGVRRASSNGSYHALRATVAEVVDDINSRKSALDRIRFPMATMVVPNWEKATTSLLRYETHRQMVLTALALKRHQIKNGRLPAELSALVPDLLPALPTDHMNGRRLTYQRLSDHRFTLRSVGVNERDDQGAVDDLIWPEPETDPATGPAAP